MSQCDWVLTTCKDEQTEVRAYGFMCMARGAISAFGLALPDSITRGAEKREIA